METLPTSDVVIVHGNSHPELANLIAGYAQNPLVCGFIILFVCFNTLALH